jgi:predicted NUDIX family phosphoesterase
MSKSKDNEVLCVTAETLARRGVSGGFTAFRTPVVTTVDTSGVPFHWHLPSDVRAQILMDASYYIPRAAAETDEGYRQVIPYCLVYTFGGVRPLAYRRRGGGEPRLDGDRSIGWGGHVGRRDADGHAGLCGIATALVRELDEELGIGPPDYANAIYWTGLIDDRSNPVGRVHLGIVARVALTPDAVVTPSEEHRECEFCPVQSLHDRIGEYETWSRLIIQDIYERR